MIKNGRPYTNENGWEDGGLITDHGDEVKKAVDGWIGKNIRTAKKILRGRTSYGMKHILEHDTGIYLTNNEFKDAMLLAGYSPVNPGELNWPQWLFAAATPDPPEQRDGPAPPGSFSCPSVP